jgi:hypothetical protein
LTNYRVNVGWDHVPIQLARYQEYGCDLDLDFQRQHVWTEQQQIALYEKQKYFDSVRLISYILSVGDFNHGPIFKTFNFFAVLSSW